MVHRRRSLLAGVAVLVLVTMVVVVRARGGDDEKATPRPSSTTTTTTVTISTTTTSSVAGIGGTPSWFDAETATAVYESGSYDVDAAALQYLQSRITGLATSGIALDAAVVTNHPGAFDTATATVKTSGGPAGVVHLRVDGGEREWEVVGAFVEGVDVHGASFADGSARIFGVNRSGTPARLVRRSVDGTLIDDLPLGGDAFDVSTATHDPILLTIELDREPNIPVGFAEVRVDAPNVEAIWPGQPSNGPPEEIAKRFATNELGSRAEVDSTSIRATAATITFRLFGPDGTEWSGVIVELKADAGHWYVTQAYSRDITVSASVDPNTNQLSYTVSSLGAQVAWVDARPPGEGFTGRLDGVSPVTLQDGAATGTIAVPEPPPRVLVVLARSAELGDRYWLQRVTA